MGFKIFKEMMGEELFEQKMEQADEVGEVGWHQQFYRIEISRNKKFLNFGDSCVFHTVKLLGLTTCMNINFTCSLYVVFI